jgi:lipoate-protein ligase B
MTLVVRDLLRCPYRRALVEQETLVERKLGGDTNDYLLLLEHEPVFTLGRGADEGDLLGADNALGVEAIRVGRGGGVTFHGPGQLVAYPILSLREPHHDVRAYVRALEGVLIACLRHFGLYSERQPGMPGVWIEGRKIASVGVGIRRWVTLHGVALNVSTDLSYFSRIVTCRTPGLRVTSLERELGAAPDASLVRRLFVEEFLAEFVQGEDHQIQAGS